MKALYDVDDLWTPKQIEDYLVPLHDANPNFRVTCYAIPNKLGPVKDLREKYPWIIFGQHGWEHTQFECRAWTEDDANWYISRALEMGYDPLFKPPNWIWDDEIMPAMEAHGITFHHHPEDKKIEKWAISVPLFPFGTPKTTNFHTHIQPNPVTDSILTHAAFTPNRVKEIELFLDPISVLKRSGL